MEQICLQSWSKRGPIMPAILVQKGTKYACNLGFKGDQICLQSWFKRGLNMPAIDSDRDYICLQWWSRYGPNMPAMIKIFKFWFPEFIKVKNLVNIAGKNEKICIQLDLNQTIQLIALNEKIQKPFCYTTQTNIMWKP